MMTMYKYLIFIAVALASCNSATTSSQKSGATAPAATVEVDFSADSAYKYVADQVAFGPRVPGTGSHAQCLDYLTSALARHGATVTVQEGEGQAFDGTMLPVRNVIAQFAPEKANRVLLCAHWDSRPFADHDPDPGKRNNPIDGANDGASGVGVLLEIARQLGAKLPKIGVDIILFDTEDYGQPNHIRSARYTPDSWCLGSQHWVRSAEGQNSQARFGILLDMVGAPNALFYREMFSTQYAADVVDKVWKTAATLGYGNYFVSAESTFITDDHYYVNLHTDVPCIDIIQYDPTSGTSFGKYWHTHDDTMDNIDRATLEAVGRTVLTVVYNEK